MFRNTHLALFERVDDAAYFYITCGSFWGQQTEQANKAVKNKQMKFVIFQKKLH